MRSSNIPPKNTFSKLNKNICLICLTVCQKPILPHEPGLFSVLSWSFGVSVVSNLFSLYWSTGKKTCFNSAQCFHLDWVHEKLFLFLSLIIQKNVKGLVSSEDVMLLCSRDSAFNIVHPSIYASIHPSTHSSLGQSSLHSMTNLCPFFSTHASPTLPTVCRRSQACQTRLCTTHPLGKTFN